MTKALRSLLAEFNRTGHYMYFLEDGIPAWTSNGYVAIKQVVAPTSKKADILDKMPDISLFMVGDYEPAEVFLNGNGQTCFTGRTAPIPIDRVYGRKLWQLFPRAKFETAEPFDPVRFVVGGEVVALLMPTSS